MYKDKPGNSFASPVKNQRDENTYAKFKKAWVFWVILGILSCDMLTAEVKLLRKYRSSFIAPAAVMGIMLCLFACYKIYPFGDRTIAWCDMNQQVIPFLMEFKDVLSGKTNFFLNLQNAGGMSFWGVFLFFISSPFSFLVALVSKQEIYHLVNLLVLLKMMTCGLTASIFFRRRLDRLNALQNVSLSLMYAFSGYAMFYYQNHVWLDIMYLFPVLLLGLLDLTEKGHVGLYIFSFSAIMAINFYLSYMVSIFLVLACGLYLAFCSPKPTRGKSVVLLGISSLLVLLLTAVIWLPSLWQYLNSARTGDLLKSLKTGDLMNQWETSFSLILCTGALIAALALYVESSFGRHSKKANFIFAIILLTLIPVFIDPINKMWHTGSYQAFPVRYGYIPIFFSLILYGIYLSEQESHNLFHRANPAAGIISTALVILLAVYLIDKKYKTLSVYTRTLWCSQNDFYLVFTFFLIAGLAYFAIASICNRGGKFTVIGSILLCITVVAECVFNMTVYMVSPISSASAYSSITDLADKVKDNSFYRVKSERKYFEVNLIGALGYNSLSHYTSLTNQNYLYLMKKLGYSSYWMEVNSNGGTEFSDAILGNRYSIIKSNDKKGSDNIVYQNDSYALKQNSNSLPIGLVMQASDITALQNLPKTSRTKIQQYLFQSIFNSDAALFHEYIPSELFNVSITKDAVVRTNYTQYGYINYSIPVTGTETLYFDCFDKLTNKLTEPINSSMCVYVNGSLMEADYPSQNNNALLNLGTYSNQTIQIQVEVRKDISVSSFGITGMQNKVLKQAVSASIPAQLSQHGNCIVGTAKTDTDNGYLFLPLNFEVPGYTAYINNQKVPIIRVFDSMMAVKLQRGENAVSIRYIPPGFLTGLWISVVGLLLLFGFIQLYRNKLYHKLRCLELPAQISFSVLFAGVFFMVYIFPLLVYFKK